MLLLGRIAALARCDLLIYSRSSVVCPAVCLSVTIVTPAKSGWTDREFEMPFGMWTQAGPRNHVLIWWFRSPRVKWQLWVRKGVGPGHARACPSVEVLIATQQGAESVRWGCWLECIGWGAHWRNLANTVEPSVCNGDAALCQITLTTCFWIVDAHRTACTDIRLGSACNETVFFWFLTFAYFIFYNNWFLLQAGYQSAFSVHYAFNVVYNVVSYEESALCSEKVKI